MNVSESERCEVEVYDAEGDGGPCDLIATGWGWYDGGAHEPLLHRACIHHQTDGAEDIAALVEKVARVRALADEFDGTVGFRGVATVVRAALQEAL